MKKRLIICLGSLLCMALTACNGTAEPVSSSKDAENQEVRNKSGLTLEEVYEKALERQNALKSTSANIKMDQVIKFGNGTDSIEMTTQSDMKMDMVIDPIAMYMSGTMIAPDDTGEAANIDMEMYMAKNGLYLYDTEVKQWLKLPSDQFEAIIGQSTNQVNASEQLKDLKTFIDDFKFEQTDKEFVLTLNAASEEFSNYILDQMQLNEMVGLVEEEQQLIEKMKFNKVNYIIKIDKETFDIQRMDTNVDMSIDIQGESINVTSNTEIGFDNFNGIVHIDVPQEVIEKAVEIQY